MELILELCLGFELNLKENMQLDLKLSKLMFIELYIILEGPGGAALLE